MDTTQLKPILEAALLASVQPLSLPQLESVFAGGGEAASREDIVAALDALRDDCARRGIELVEVASGYRYQVRQAIHPWVARLWTERPARYSRALLETLALIAYRQPITRGEIEQVRGVAVSTHITRTLEEREWIRVVGHRETPGRPALFGTTRTFLDYFNLKSLDELPPLAEILNLEELDPQLALDAGVPQVGPPEAASVEDASSHPEAVEATTAANDAAPSDVSDDEPDDAPGAVVATLAPAASAGSATPTQGREENRA